jgi:hypothetical protein
MIKYLILILAVHYSAPGIYSQCSDAGVCTLGKYYLKEHRPYTSSVSLGYIYGTSGKDADVNGTLNNLSYGSFKLEADIDILKNTRLAVGMPYTFVSGPLGDNNGAGDLTVAFTRSFKIETIHTLSFSLGGKFATGNVNSSDSLPQRYMPGLGTNDLLLGASYQYLNYYFGVGYQKSFGRSRNYITRLKHGDDILVRAGFFEQFNKVGVKAEILTIIKIKPSSILNTSSAAESFIEIDGSNEPQVNLLGTLTYQASREIDLTVQAAIPFLKRDYNFDGLKRTLSLAGSVSYFFTFK